MLQHLDVLWRFPPRQLVFDLLKSTHIETLSEMLKVHLGFAKRIAALFNKNAHNGH
jgi:hypothetical protein